MKAVILAGGLGSRLRPFTEVIPKPLLPIGEKSVLEIQIDRLKQHGFKDIYLATNYKADYIENFFGDGSRYDVNLFISRENKPLGTAGPLALLKDQLQSEPFLVMNGDILSLVDFSKLYAFSSKNDTILNITIKKMITPYAFGNIFFNGDLVLDIEEKPNFTTYALAGIYIMKPEIFEHIPNDEYYGMDQLIKTLIAKKIPISKYEIEEYWLDIGRLEDYTKAQEEFGKRFNNEDQ